MSTRDSAGQHSQPRLGSASIASRTRVAALRAAFALIALWTAYSLAGQSGEGVLRVEIRDQSTGQVVPAMVCITSLEDHKWRVPPDGRVSPAVLSAKDIYDPKPWTPGDPGPVVLTNGDPQDNDVRAVVYRGRPVLPFWHEAAAYFVSRPFDITLPAGKWRLAVMRGLEYEPVFEEFALAAGQQKSRKIALKRWVHMARQGWYSGDDHVHHPRTEPWHDEFLLTWAQAEEVYLTNILRMGDLQKTYFEQSAYGPDGRVQRGDFILAPGQEDPRTGIDEQGHTIALNITAPIRDTSRYHLYDFMFDGAREQGGFAGYAHKSWALKFLGNEHHPYPTWDSTISVVRGKIDFFEIMQFRDLGVEDYYDFLNLGFKIIASAGSDFPWGTNFGECRVYAYTGPNFSADAWFEAFEKGRTFVSNGPMLSLTVEESMPGDELRVGRNSTVRIKARAWAPEVIGAPKRLEVISQGEVLRSAESSDTAKQELSLEFNLKADQSRWIAARVVSHKEGYAHTSPVYLVVDGRKFWHRERLPQLVAKRMKILDFVEGRLADPEFTAEYASGEVRELRKRVTEARELYRGLEAAQKAESATSPP